MNNKFENTGLQDNKSNWMAEELRYESRINTWLAFDNAARLDEDHREHCDAKKVEISKVNSTPNLYTSEGAPQRVFRATPSRSGPMNTIQRSKNLVAIVFIAYFLIMLISIFSMFLD